MTGASLPRPTLGTLREAADNLLRHHDAPWSETRKLRLVINGIAIRLRSSRTELRAQLRRLQYPGRFGAAV